MKNYVSYFLKLLTSQLILDSSITISVSVSAPVKHKSLLTEADGSQQTQAVLRREAGGEQRLQDVVGESQRDHGLVGRVDDQHGDPQPQEPAKRRHIRTQV